MNQRENHIVTGMSRDLSVSKFNDKLVCDARNIRITARNGRPTLLGVTNEKGPKQMLSDQLIQGTLLGYAVLDNMAVLFTAGKKDPDEYQWDWKIADDPSGQSDYVFSKETIAYSGESLKLGYTSTYYLNKEKLQPASLVNEDYDEATGGVQFIDVPAGILLYDEANGAAYQLHNRNTAAGVTSYGLAKSDTHFLLYPPDGEDNPGPQTSDTFVEAEYISGAENFFFIESAELSSLYVYDEDGSTYVPLSTYLTPEAYTSGYYTVPLSSTQGIVWNRSGDETLYVLLGKDFMGRDVRLKSFTVELDGNNAALSYGVTLDYWPATSTPVYDDAVQVNPFTVASPMSVITYNAFVPSIETVALSGGMAYSLPDNKYIYVDGYLYAPFETTYPAVNTMRRSNDITFIARDDGTFTASVIASRICRIGTATISGSTVTVNSIGFPTVASDTIGAQTYVKGDAVQPSGPFYAQRYIVTKKARKVVEGESDDRIYRIDFNGHDEPVLTEIFKGDLNFDRNYPIETLPFIESEDIKKVYWVDGLNQPRVINVSETLEEDYKENTDGTKYDFNRSVQLDHTLSVEKRNYGGYFPSGTIQYCFTYFNRNAQETNIIDVTPLYYLSPKERGVAADGNTDCSFKVTIGGADTSYDYIRLYALLRTSENAAPACRIVGDYPIGNLINLSLEIAFSSGSSLDVNGAVIRNISTGKDTRIVLNKPYYNSTIWYAEITLDSSSFIYSEGILYAPYKLDSSGNLVRVNTIYATGKSQGGTVYTVSVSSPVLTNEGSVYAFSEESVLTAGIEVVDNGAIGSSFDATALLFMGGESIVADTLAQKDNTLFLGNIKLKNNNIGSVSVGNSQTFADYVRNVTIGKVSLDYRGNEVDYSNPYTPSGSSFYDYTIDNNRSSYAVRRFKFGEHYRLGLIGQYEDGSWSEAVWVGDTINTKYPELDTTYATGAFSLELSGDACSALYGAGIRRIAPVVVYPDISDRLVICQGVLSPTVYNVAHRAGNMPFSQASWYFRMLGNPMETHNSSIAPSWDPYGEIQSITDNKMYTTLMYRTANATEQWTDAETMDSTTFVDTFGENFFIDYNILTFNSPDLDELQNVDFSAFGMRITGFADVTDYSDDYDVITSTAPIASDGSLQKTQRGRKRFAYPGYIDGAVSRSEINTVRRYGDTLYGWLVYPWHRAGSVNNQGILTTSQESSSYGRTALLSSHTTATLLYARSNYFRSIFSEDDRFMSYEPAVSSIRSFTGDTPSVVLDSGQKLYYGNIDDVLLPSYGGSDAKLYSYWNPMKWNSNLKAHRLTNIGGSGKPFTCLYKVKKRFGYKVYSLFRKRMTDTEYANIGQYGNSWSIGELLDQVSSIIASSVNYDELFTWWEGYRYIDSSKAPATITDLNDYHGTEGNEYANNASFTMQISSGSHYGTSTPFHTESSDNNVYENFSTDAVPMKYKSHRHLVVSLEDDKYLPCSLRKGDIITSDLSTQAYVIEDYLKFWENTTSKYSLAMTHPYELEKEGIFLDASVADRVNRPYYYGYDPSGRTNLGQVYIADIVRKFNSTADMEEFNRNSFGGTSESALLANTWVRCGESVSLTMDSSAKVLFKQGDTYLERWDCLKTTQYADGDANSIVEILSTDIESRVNLDERYDRNRGLRSNLYVTEQNFNLYNDEGYDQSGNFFNYHTIDYKKVKSLLYPNMVTWSKEKVLGEDVDTWTSINLTSTLDLDGDKGVVRRLMSFNNEIFAFQDDGVSQILFNSRVQIPVSDNNPVEITNGYKVDGKRYIANGIGLVNKWSLQSTPLGMYWIDDKRHDFYKFDGSLHNLSAEHGMATWFHDNAHLSEWTPVSFTERTHYDRIYQDLYITTDSDCLVYSEELQQFTSFMDYGAIPFMFNVEDNFIALRQVPAASSPVTDVWDMWQGDYNVFPDGNEHPYWMTFVVNNNPTVDKVFNTVEWRSIMHDASGEFLPHSTFTHIRAWNEHQDTGKVALYDNNGHSSSLKKKFNVFRALVPRAHRNSAYGVTRNFDRMRNPWCYLTLEHASTDTDFMEFMEASVDYFM